MESLNICTAGVGKCHGLFMIGSSQGRAFPQLLLRNLFFFSFKEINL